MRRVFFLLILSILITLAACSSRPQDAVFTYEEAEVEAGVELIASHFDAYIYRHEKVDLPSPGKYIQAAAAHENRLYYVQYKTGLQDLPALVLTSINADGSDVRQIEIQGPGNEVASFTITNEGNFAFFVFNRALTHQGMDVTAHYIEYSRDGVEITRYDFEEFNLVENPQPNEFAITGDGRVLAVDKDKSEFRELDFKSRDWGKILPFSESGSRLRGIFPAQASSPYDFLIADDSYLYGYSIKDNEQTILLSWIQSGFSDIFSAHSGIFEDDRIFLLSGGRNIRDEWESVLYILSPVHRDEVPEKIIITIKGVSVQGDLRQAVAEFNRQNRLYQIEIYEYLNQADIPFGDIDPDALMNVFSQARLRFQIDLMTGNVPDIIVQPTTEMIDRGLLHDLNPFIEADPDINREDFILNALFAMERPDGTLPSFSNKFTIQTIMSRNETLGYIEKWTPEEMFALIRSTQDISLPFGTHMVRDDFLERFIRNVNIGFIDFDNYRAYFDTGKFIDLLNTSKLLPSISAIPPDIYGYGDPNLEIQRMQTGQTLLSMVYFSSVGRYQSFTDSFDDIIAMGIPTENGGVHIILPNMQIGIGANTSHPDAAWEFLRGFLLPSASEFDRGFSGDLGFPIRIDLFNELLEDAKTPRTFINNSGELVEYPREILSAYDGSASIELYALSDNAANGLRNIVDTAVRVRQGISDELWDAIQSDLADFYSGIRPAEETARIIQNRAEIWLSEQELLSRG